MRRTASARVCFVALWALPLWAIASEASPGDAAQAPAAAGASTASHPETYLEFAVAGGPLMIPIGLCSILWLAFLVERLIATRRARVLPSPLLAGLKGLRGGTIDRIRIESLLGTYPSAAATIFQAALDRAGRPRAEVEGAVNSVAHREARVLRRNIRLFAVIASVAPLLGLLGTVVGLVQAFREVAVSGLGSGQNLAPGIYTALITTVGGLMVAIPSLVTYYWLSGRVDGFLHQIDALLVDMVDAQESGGRP